MNLPILQNTDLISVTLLLASLIPALWLLSFYRSRIRLVRNAVRHTVASSAPADVNASVIVLSGNDAQALERLITSLYEQEFEGKMEIIVVNDGKSEDIKDVVTRMNHLSRHTNLYITFTPPGARNVSHRKLSITLGIKAAHYPVVVITDEQAIIPSRRWLTAMAAPFVDPAVEVVLGSYLPDPAADLDKHGKRYRAFTHAHDAVSWLSWALRGKPYRGNGGNIAYRRDFFFAQKGFSAALNLRDGDDDIFINRTANRRNTRVVVARETQLSFSLPSSKSEYRNHRPRRFFTAMMISRSAPRFFGFSSLMAWAFAGLSTASTVLALIAREYIVAASGAVIALAVWLTIMLTWKSTLRALGSRPALFSVPLMMLRRPLTNLHHKWISRLRRKEFYTWS